MAVFRIEGNTGLNRHLFAMGGEYFTAVAARIGHVAVSEEDVGKRGLCLVLHGLEYLQCERDR